MNQNPEHKFTGRVALFHGPDAAVELKSTTWPHPTREEILVRISHCAICRSDVHTMCGRRHVTTPTVLGHEIIGNIVAVGENVSRTDIRSQDLKVGDRITWAIYAHCGECFYCRQGLPQKCDHLFKYGHEPVSPTGEGSSGGMANYILLRPGTPVLKLPDTIPAHPATPLNCAVSTAVAMLRETDLNINPQTKLVVMGGGYAGLCAVALAKAQGCGQVIVFEPNEDFHARAVSFGADEVWHPDTFSRKIADDKTSNQRTFDAALELAGSTQAASLGLQLLRTGGRLILGGTVFPSPPLTMDPDQIVRRCLTIRGNHNYWPEDLVNATRFMVEYGKDLPWNELIGAEFELANAQEAIAFAKSHPGQRAILRMDSA
jgi:putative phosphonate catabolism associated alcohol dehydrogenase